MKCRAKADINLFSHLDYAGNKPKYKYIAMLTKTYITSMKRGIMSITSIRLHYT